jgi:WD40 repeat protein
VQCVAFTLDGAEIVSGALDGTVRLWDCATGSQLACMDTGARQVCSIAVSPDDGLILCGVDDGRLIVWDRRGGMPPASFQTRHAAIVSVGFAATSSVAFSLAVDNKVSIWRGFPRMQLDASITLPSAISSAALLPDGHSILLGQSGGGLVVLNIAGQKVVRTLAGHTAEVCALAISADGRRAVSASTDRTLRLWDLGSGKELRQLSGHPGVASSVAFSHDGALVAAGSDDVSVRAWSAESGELLTRLAGHTGLVWSVAFSPTDRRLASASGDQMIRLWDPSDPGASVGTQDHDDTITLMAFSEDGACLVSGSVDGAVCIWDTATAVPQQRDRRPDTYPVAATFDRQRNSVCVTWADDGRTVLDLGRRPGPPEPPPLTRNDLTVSWAQELREAVVQHRDRPVGWFPVTPYHAAAHPSLPLFAIGHGRNVFFVKLEGMTQARP